MIKTRWVVLFLLAFVPALTRAQTPADAPATRPRMVNPAPSTAPQTQPTRTPAVVSTPTPVPAPAVVVVPQQQTPPATTTTTTPVPVPALTPAPVAVYAPLQPARPPAAAKVRAHIAEAERALKTRVRPSALGTSALNFVTLAALDTNSGQVHLLTLPKQTFLTKDFETTLTSSLGTLLRVRVVRSNYVNTAVIVADLAGRQLAPLLVEYPIEKFGRLPEMAYYTSAHPALLSPELVKTGQAYVRTMLDLAAKRLKEKGVTISPMIHGHGRAPVPRRARRSRPLPARESACDSTKRSMRSTL